MIIFALLICVAGMLGGAGNALISDNGFLLPKKDTVPGGQDIWRPGVIGNVIIGLVAALLFWLLNTDFDVLSKALVFDNTIARSIGGALLAGLGGARIITSEVDKRFFQSAASAMANTKPSKSAAKQIDNARPAQALEIAKRLARR